jgi:hypothetical protein
MLGSLLMEGGVRWKERGGVQVSLVFGILLYYIFGYFGNQIKLCG